MDRKPVVVLYTSKILSSHRRVKKMWSMPGGIIDAMWKVQPDIRSYVITLKGNSGSLDVHSWPADLRRYELLVPLIIFIPGSLWDRAMSKLGPNNDVKLIEGVHIFNGEYHIDILRETWKIVEGMKYDSINPEAYGRWLASILSTNSNIPEEIHEKPRAYAVSNDPPANIHYKEEPCRSYDNPFSAAVQTQVSDGIVLRIADPIGLIFNAIEKVSGYLPSCGGF